jgi:hypothetical protein
MTTLRFRSRPVAWLALAGMALNAFWPLLANARPNVPAIPSEICSATGFKHVADGFEGGAPAEAPGVQPSHCALCPLNAERSAAIPAAKLPPFSSSPAARQAPAFFDAGCPQTALNLTAPPRAPPFLA